MKQKKKKYNPLKKYQEGGETPKKSGMQQAIDAGIASGAPKEKGPQNMMLGRTYIPRMSQQDKQQILDAGKALVDRMRKRKKFIEEGGTGKEFRQGLREERRKKAEETEEGTEEKEMTSSEKLRDFAENEMEDLSGFDEEGDRLDEELADEEPEEENIKRTPQRDNQWQIKYQACGVKAVLGKKKKKKKTQEERRKVVLGTCHLKTKRRLWEDLRKCSARLSTVVRY